jgi:hypothetical protein
MVTDIALSIALALTGIFFVVVGVHASVNPVSPDDIKLAFWKRHRTRIWGLLAVFILVNISLVVVQARRQGASTVTSEEFRAAIADLKTMYGRATAVGILTSTASIQPKTAIDKHETRQQVAQRANIDTSAQIAVVNQAQKPTIPPLSEDQISLVNMSAIELAKTIREDYVSQLKQYNDRINSQEKEDEERWERQGKSKEEAEQLLASQHTGGAMSARSNDRRGIASIATHNHLTQIQSIVNVIASDPTRYQGEMVNRLRMLIDTCSIPDDSPENCSKVLEGLSLILK